MAFIRLSVYGDASMKSMSVRINSEISLKLWMIICSFFPLMVNIYIEHKTPLPIYTNHFLEQYFKSYQFLDLNFMRIFLIGFLFVLVVFAKRQIAIWACWSLFLVQFCYIFFFYTEVLEMTQLSLFYPLLFLNFFSKEGDSRNSARMFLIVFFFTSAVYKLNTSFMSGLEFYPGSMYYSFIREEFKDRIQEFSVFLSLSSIIIKLLTVYFLFFNLRRALFCILFFWLGIYIITPVIGSVAFLAALPILILAFCNEKSLKIWPLICFYLLALSSWVWQVPAFNQGFPALAALYFLYFSYKYLVRSEVEKLDYKYSFQPVFIPAIAASLWSLMPLLGLTTRPLGFTMYAFPPFYLSEVTTQHYNRQECILLKKKFIFKYSVVLKEWPTGGCVVKAINDSPFIRIHERTR